jgi:non-specific serine/threonine protein kinase
MAIGLSGTEPQAGALIGDFRLERLLARGGMGVVFEAHQLSQRRRVALKLIAPEAIADGKSHARFAREAQAVIELEHPNVVPVYAAGEAEGLLFIAMRFIDGANLGRIIARGRLDPVRIAGLIEQVAAGLDAAHSRGLVHRDVKPGNVMVETLARGREHCYVVDFGVSLRRDATPLTGGGNWVGTPAYVAPEQLLGEPVDARTDVYALAVLAFHALTGQPPYEREHQEGVLFAHLNAVPPRATELNDDLPPAVDRVIARALAKRPDERYPSAGEFAGALTAALRGAGDTRLPLSAAERSSYEERALPSGAMSATTTRPARATGTIKNLAGTPSSFVGRERELEQLGVLLTSSRLVTIVGPGGVGKTRLALRAAAELRDAYEEVRLIELASLGPRDDVPLAVARGLELHVGSGPITAPSIAALVGRRAVLVVLDNCEQIVAEIGRFASELLACSTGLVLLVTSGQALSIDGEQVHRLAPMSVPEEGTGALEIATSEAVRLLTERAADHGAPLALTDASTARLASICRRLDGIPLAIELAAARLGTIGAADLDDLLAREFGLLAGTRREGPVRHRTLEQLIDWSWRLLSEAQQAVLMRLSVLVGPFDLAAAERVAAPPDHPRLEVCTTVLDLVDRSMLQVETTEPRTRLRLLEPVRDYCSRQLASGGGTTAAMAELRAHYRTVAEQAVPGLESKDTGAWMRRLDEDHANLRAAIVSGLEDEPVIALEIAVALTKYWRSRGLASDAVQLLAAGLERARSVRGAPT